MSPKISQINLLRRTAALMCAAFTGLGLAAGPLRAQTPVPAPNPSPAAPTPYSSPLFHAGGEFTPPLFPFPAPIPFPDPLYGQLQGTPVGLVPGTGVNAGTEVSTEIPSFLLGNYLPTLPPAAPGIYFPNHFRDGTAFSWSAPLTFLTPAAVAPPTSPTGATLVPTVESTPTAVNVTEYPFIKTIRYVGTVTGTASTPDMALYVGSTIPGLHSGSAPAGSPQLIRQVVYFGREENISTATTTNGTTTVANTPVGAIYCVDGFTGEVIWRYQTSSYSDGSVFSAPAIAYINVLTNAGATPPVYANKAVVIVGDNNGFVYCLDATGNGDGTSNSNATTTVTGVPGTTGYPNYIPQPAYGAAAPPAILPAHVGTTSIYWAYRPDPATPQNTTRTIPGFNASTALPVPGPFGIASPNIYIEHEVSTTGTTLASNAIIYLGNTRDCVYALDGLGVANTSAVPYNASLPQITTGATTGTGIPDNVPTTYPHWWFTPDKGANSGISFESTPALSPPTAPFPTVTIVTATPNPVQPNGSVTFSATVTDASGSGGLPTGNVTFKVGGVTSPPEPLDGSGVATYATTASATPGPETVTATYAGDGTFLGSTSPTFNEQVDGGVGTSNTVVTSSVNPSVPGEPVTFTATVTAGGLLATPLTGGTVTFTVNGTALTPQPDVNGTVSYTTAALPAGTRSIQADYSGVPGVAGNPAVAASNNTLNQVVFGPLGPTVYISSSQELGATSNAGRIYALDGLSGPTYATTPTGPDLSQRPKWAYPNLYFSGNGSVPDANGKPLPVRPALGNVTGSPVVFTNTDDTVAAVGTAGSAGYIPAHPRTRIYFAADSGLEVPAGGTQPYSRPASDTTGRVWAIETNGKTAFTTEGANKTVWSFPQANDPNNAAQDFTPEPSVPMGAFLDATPAIGFVQFPTTIEYTNAGALTPYTHTDTVNTTNVLGKSVPMLYIGTNGTADLGFYALDVDGSTDAERGVYRLESPTGSSFTSSPVLVTNSSTSGGNGGAVYATSGNTLLQITATPISNINTGQAFAFIGVDAQFSGGGPISGPSVAAANTSDLATNVAGSTNYGGKNVNATDFVYFGDDVLGFCRGITPIDSNDGGAVPPANFGSVVDTNPVAQYSNKFFLQAYLFDGSSTYPATTTDMSKAISLNSTIRGFEWGGFAYVRIGNVVPPCPATDVAAPKPSELVADPTDPTLFYGNGQAVNFSVGRSTVTVPALNGAAANIATTLTGAATEKVFVQRSDPAPGTDAAPNSTQLVSASNQKGWLAAYSYPIGSAETRIGDTPGAFRRIRQATQTATVYTASTADGITTYTATGTISLIIQTTLGSQYAVGNPPTGIAQTPPAEQPTFGILNPLAVEGEGVTLPVNGGTPSVQPVADNVGGAGPFRAVSSTPTTQDFAAYSNGSNHLTSLPKSGYNPATEDPTKILSTLDEQAATGSIPITIATSVGDIIDGGSGSNIIASNPNVYGLEVENRSLVGSSTVADPANPSALLFPPLNVAMGPASAHWNDNTTDANGTTQNGPGATVNPLPWEDLSALSSIILNTSQDYPDVPASAITHTLSSGAGSGSLDIGPGNPSTATLSPAGVSGGKQVGTLNSIQFAYTVPTHQPANLQVWDGTPASGNGGGVVGPKTPETMNTGDAIFPHGYIEGSGSGAGINAGGGAPQRVFVDVGEHGRFNTIYPYREVESFAGVPVDMKTEITNGTVSLGNGPSALGIQTEQYTPLGLFDPYNVNYQTFFKPLTVLNEGNTNLLNVQFNQQSVVGSGTSALQFPLMAYVDANDPLSGFGGFDYNSTSGPLASGQRTYNGSPIPLPYTAASVNEQPFIFRTSLDTDLMQAYGRNPGIVGNTNYLYPAQTNATIGNLYSGATSHKPRVGVSSTTLTVPDVPESGTPGYSLDAATVPTLNVAVPYVTSTAPPYVGISVPFGTPVGSYATADTQPLRLFEGQDFQANGQFYPPTYSGAIGGHQAQSSSGLVTHLLLDSNPQVNPNAQPLLPASTGVKLNINVIEDRLTDGFTALALPMIDAGPAGSTGGNSPAAISTPDFAPAAFRDPNTGNLSVYWTSQRSGGFNIFGATVSFTPNNTGNLPPGTGYFSPADTAAQRWWNPIYPPAASALAAGTNSGLSVTPGLNGRTIYAFDATVSSTAPYSNTLHSYMADPGTGALTANGAVTPASSASQVKYGVKGLYTSFTNPLWAFWTGSTRGRTALYYNSQANGAWGATVNLLPVPAGLTAVADASPMLMTTYPGGTQTTDIEVTYSGTAPDGNIDLYVSRYVPAGTTAATASQLNLAAFPAVTENLRAVGGWYQARDVAWSRTGALNVSVAYVDTTGKFQTAPLLYDTNNVPQFTKAIYDKPSGLLVLTGVHVRYVTPPASPAPQFTVNTVYVDAATGRVRFSPALLPTQNFPAIRATFSPEARRLTLDTRADTAPVTFLDTAMKANDDPYLAQHSTSSATVEADRRWTIWRKSGVVGSAATLYYKTQRLTAYLPSAVNTAQTITIMLNNQPYNGAVDVDNVPPVYNDFVQGQPLTVKYPASAILYFPISSGAEGRQFSVTYTPVGPSGTSTITSPVPPATDTVQWQDYVNANDSKNFSNLSNPNADPPIDSVSGLDSVIDTEVPLNNATNENNVAAFLDPFAGPTSSHKVWLFWNSTRNGTADIYSETIDPRFAPGP